MVNETGTILNRILATKREEIAAISPQERSNLIAQCRDAPPVRGFAAALVAASGSVVLIAEVKKASPSKGIIRADFAPAKIARAYYEGGASCLSVLTDETYFQGHLEYLRDVRAAVPLPLLRKDFVVDAVQMYQARVFGADAVLLIVAALPNAGVLREMRETAENLGLDVLVEVHDEAELETAANSGATLIGVNNRSLHTFEVRLETTERLLPLFPPNTIAVAESGIFTPADIERVRKVGAKAVLVGESLMRQTDIVRATRDLLTAR